MRKTVFERKNSSDRVKMTKVIDRLQKEASLANYFLAINNKQLGTCLRMLFAEGIQGTVQVVLNNKNKIEFHIYIEADEDLFERLKERYAILIS